MLSPEIPSNLNSPMILTLQVFSRMPICTGYWDDWRQGLESKICKPLLKILTSSHAKLLMHVMQQSTMISIRSQICKL